MKIRLLDASEYFRGLLLLIRQDHTITESETRLIRRVGKTLGFEKEFCDNAIQDILENEYIREGCPCSS